MPLNFTLSCQLSAPTVAAYRFRIGQFVNDDSGVNLQTLVPSPDQPLPRNGHFILHRATKLKTALRGIGAIANWKVLDSGTLGDFAESQSGSPPADEYGKTAEAFQINALTSKNWHLDSGWKSLSITQE